MSGLSASSFLVKGGTVAGVANSLVHEFSQRNNITLVQEVGLVLLKADIATYLASPADAAVVERNAQMVLQCLEGGWSIGQDINTVDYKKSCSLETFTRVTDKRWRGSFSSKFLPPAALAFLSGGILADFSVTALTGTGSLIYIEETLTAVASVVTLTKTPVHIISVRKKTNPVSTATTVIGDYFHQIEDGGTPVARQFTHASGATLTFQATHEATTQFTVVYTYRSTTATDGIAVIGDATRVPSTFDFVGSWLMVDAESDNALGRLIIEATDCQRTGALEIGGAGAQADETFTIGFNVNGTQPNIWINEF